MKTIKIPSRLENKSTFRKRNGRYKKLTYLESSMFETTSNVAMVMQQAVSDSYLHIAENKNELFRAHQEIMTLKMQIRNMQATLSEIVKKEYK